MQRLFSTATSPRSARLDAWSEACRRAFGRLAIEDADESLHGCIEANVFGAMRVARIQGTRQRVRRRLERDALSQTWNVLLQLEGECRVSCCDGSVLLHAGQFVAVDGAKEFSLDLATQFRQALFQFPRAAITQDLLGCRTRASSCDDPADALVASHLQLLLERADALSVGPRARLAQPTIQILGVASTFAPASDLPFQLRCALHLIDANLHDPAFDVNALVAMLGTGSRRFFEQTFARHGMTIARELWRRRVERAASLLRDPSHDSRSLLHVALSCGFREPAHFSRLFRARHGVSPRTFRLQHRHLR